MWTLKTFQERFVRWKAREVDGTTARLAVENGWFDGDRKFVNEEVEILTHHVKDGQRQLEFTLKFEAVDQPVEIVGTSEGKKGFGGFCFRLRPATAARRRLLFAPTRALPGPTVCWIPTPGPKSRVFSTANLLVPVW